MQKPFWLLFLIVFLFVTETTRAQENDSFIIVGNYTQVAFHPHEDNILATVSSDENNRFFVHIWDVDRSSQLMEIEIDGIVDRSMLWSSDGSYFLLLNSLYQLFIIEYENNGFVRVIDFNHYIPNKRIRSGYASMDWDSSSENLLILAEGCLFIVNSLESPNFKCKYVNEIGSVEASPSAPKIAIVTAVEEHLPSERIFFQIPPRSPHIVETNNSSAFVVSDAALDWNPLQPYLAISLYEDYLDQTFTIEIWDTDEYALKALIRTRAESVNQLKWSMNGNYLAFIESDECIQIISTINFKSVWNHCEERKTYLSLSWADNGNLAVSDLNGYVYFYKIY